MKLGGLTLEQYTGVVTALAERLPLPEILAQEQIPEADWPGAERAWRRAIAESYDLQMVHVQKRRVAEDCLARKTAPLESDPAAWTGLLSALSSADDPDALTRSLGLTMADVGRLGRVWKQKVTADPELGKKLQELAPTAKAPTKIDVDPPALKPFPWTPPKQTVERVLPAQQGAPAERVDLPVSEPQRHLASFQLKPVAIAPEAAPSPVPAKPNGAPVGAETAWSSGRPSDEPTTPFEAPDPEARGVSLTQYATLVAKLQSPGVDRGATLARASLDDASYASVSAHYDKLFSKKAMLSLEFGRLLSNAQKALAEERDPPAAKPRQQPQTLDFPIASVVAAAEASKAAPVPRSAPTLSVAQYAWVFATLRKVPPADLPVVLERLRLTEDTRRRLDEEWAARIRKDSSAKYGFTQGLQRLLPIDEVDAVLHAILAPTAPAAAKGSSTADIPRSTLDAANARAATPFAKAGESSAKIPLAAYAQIAALVAKEGNPVSTLQRLGVDPRDWQSTVQAYARQFAEQPGLRVEFEQLVQLWGINPASER